MELIQVGKNTYYIKNRTNIGVYKIDEKNVYLIDTGNDKEAGKKIIKIIEEKGWNIKGIINTHSNADHIGGNKVIRNRTKAPIYAYNIEKSIAENTILEPSFLYGGYPFKDLQNKFLMADPSSVLNIEGNLPNGLSFFPLKGHFFDMIGIKTDDNVYFLADSLFSKETIEKYHIFFIYNVKEYLDTLENLKKLKGSLFIPSHVEATNHIEKLIQMNKEKVEEVSKVIYDYINEVTFEEIVKYIFDFYHLSLNINQYVLVGSTIKSYLSYLLDEGMINYLFKENKMFWIKKEEEK